MVESDVGDHGHIRVDDVNGVETSTKPHLQYRVVDPGAANQDQRGEDRILEIRQFNPVATRLDFLECTHDGAVVNLPTAHANAFVEPVQVWRGGAAH